MYLTDWTDDYRHGVNKITPTTSYSIGFGCPTHINFFRVLILVVDGYQTCKATSPVLPSGRLTPKGRRQCFFLAFIFLCWDGWKPRIFCQWNGHVWRRVRYLLRQIGIACEPPPDGVIHCKYIIGELLVSTVKCVSRDSNTSIRYI